MTRLSLRQVSTTISIGAAGDTDAVQVESAGKKGISAVEHSQLILAGRGSQCVTTR